MTAHLVTFSDESMSHAATLCRDSAIANGVDGWWYYTPDILDGYPEYADKEGWFEKRGCGYWLFKPVIVNQVLAQPNNGDILIYSDAGVEFINNVNYIIDRMDQDIFLFGNNWEHAHWCKRDVVEAIWPNDGTDHSSWDAFGKQCQASVIFFRVSDYSRKFVAEWLKWCLHRERFSTICTDEWRYLIDDSPSRLPNHPEFREHRHDQAILTTLAYREGIKLHYWPAVYNKGGSPEFVYEKLPEYAGDDYPVLFSHHRKRNHEWPGWTMEYGEISKEQATQIAAHRTK